MNTPASNPETVAMSFKWLQMLKENRIEMMIVSILLYSTGLLQKVFTYSSGVCS